MGIVWLPRTLKSVDRETKEELEDELLHAGVFAEVADRTGVSVDIDTVVEALMWLCEYPGGNYCPAVITEGSKAIVVKIRADAEEPVEIYDLTAHLVGHVKGLLTWSPTE
jgi:hypothetical protein